MILAACSGFVYCISVAGTTGVRDRLPEELREQLKWLSTMTDLPLAVGFGVSQPRHVEALRGLADGVIVGSALIDVMEAEADREAKLRAACRYVGSLRAALDGSKTPT